MHRLSALTGVPEQNSEYLQMLRYEPGQYYHVGNVGPATMQHGHHRVHLDSTLVISLSLPIPPESS